MAGSGADSQCGPSDPPWGALGSELVQAIASQLQSEHAQAMRQVCRGWARGVGDGVVAVHLALGCDCSLRGTGWPGHAALTQSHNSGALSSDRDSGNRRSCESPRADEALDAPARQRTALPTSLSALQAPHLHLLPCKARKRGTHRCSGDRGDMGACMDAAAVVRAYPSYASLTAQVCALPSEAPPHTSNPNSSGNASQHQRATGGSSGRSVAGSKPAAMQQSHPDNNTPPTTCDLHDPNHTTHSPVTPCGRVSPLVAQGSSHSSAGGAHAHIAALQILLHTGLRSVTLVGDLPWAELLGVAKQVAPVAMATPGVADGDSDGAGTGAAAASGARGGRSDESAACQDAPPQRKRARGDGDAVSRDTSSTAQVHVTCPCSLHEAPCNPCNPTRTPDPSHHSPYSTVSKQAVRPVSSGSTEHMQGTSAPQPGSQECIGAGQQAAGTQQGAAGQQACPGPLTWRALMQPLQHLTTLRLLGYQTVPPVEVLRDLAGLRLNSLDLRLADPAALELACPLPSPRRKASSSRAPAAAPAPGTAAQLTDEHLSALSDLPTLTSLQLSNVTAVTPQGLSSLYRLTRLHTLGLTSALNGQVIHATHIQTLAAALPGLRCLSIGRSLPWSLPVGGGSMAQGAASWHDSLSHFTGLDYLGLQMVHSVDPTALSSVSSLVQLKTVDIEAVDLGYGEISALVYIIKPWSALRHVMLTTCVIYDTQVESLATLTQLKQLTLHMVDVRSRDLSGWTSLAPLTALTHFEFKEWNNPVLSVGNLAVLTDESVTMMTTQWRALTELRYVGKVQLSAKARHALATLPRLTRLDITGPDGACCLGTRFWAAGTADCMRTNNTNNAHNTNTTVCGVVGVGEGAVKGRLSAPGDAAARPPVAPPRAAADAAHALPHPRAHPHGSHTHIHGRRGGAVMMDLDVGVAGSNAPARASPSVSPALEDSHSHHDAHHDMAACGAMLECDNIDMAPLLGMAHMPADGVGVGVSTGGENMDTSARSGAIQDETHIVQNSLHADDGRMGMRMGVSTAGEDGSASAVYPLGAGYDNKPAGAAPAAAAPAPGGAYGSGAGSAAGLGSGCHPSSHVGEDESGEVGAGGLWIRLVQPRCMLSSCNGAALSGTPSLGGSEDSEDSVNWEGCGGVGKGGAEGGDGDMCDGPLSADGVME